MSAKFLPWALATTLCLMLASSSGVARESLSLYLPAGSTTRLDRSPKNAVQNSTDGAHLAVGGSAGIWIYDAQTREIVSSRHTASVYSAAVSSDGRTFASVRGDGAMLVWDAGMEPTDTGPSTGPDVLKGHAGLVSAVDFGPDSRILASAGRDGTVRLWEVDGGRLRHTLEHGSWVTEVVFGPDGHILASADQNGTVRLWEVDGGQPRHTLEHGSGVTEVAFSPDGHILASADRDGTVRLWEVNGGRYHHILRRHTAPVYSLAFSPDGRTLASADQAGIVRLWEVDGGRLRHTLQRHAAPVYSLAFSPDGHTLASTGQVGIVHLWEVDGGRLLHTLQGHAGRVTDLAFSPDGRVLASADRAGTVRLWEADDGRLHHALRWHAGRVTNLAFSPDGRILASAGRDGTVRLWEAAGGRLRHTLEHGTWVTELAFSPDGRILTSAGTDGTVRLWDLVTKSKTGASATLVPTASSDPVPLQVGRIADGRLERAGGEDAYHVILDAGTAYRIEVVLDTLGDSVLILYGPNGERLAESDDFDNHAHASRIYHIPVNAGIYQIRVRGYGSYKGSYRLSVTEIQRPRQILEGHEGWVTTVVFAPNGRILASAGEDGTVRLWETNSGRLCHILELGSWVTRVAFSPYGALASGSLNGSVRLWEPDDRRFRRVLRGHVEAVLGVVFSPDGDTLASGSRDGIIRLWEVDGGRLRHTLVHGGVVPEESNADRVSSVAFSPDGRTLASAGIDGVRLWEVATGSLQTTLVQATLEDFGLSIGSVAVSPDGRTLAGIDGYGSVHLFEMATGTLQATLGKYDFESVVFSPDGRTLAGANWWGGSVHLWEIDGGRLFQTLEHGGYVSSVAFSPDGRTLASAGDEGTVRLWNLATEPETELPPAPTAKSPLTAIPDPSCSR